VVIRIRISKKNRQHNQWTKEKIQKDKQRSTKHTFCLWSHSVILSVSMNWQWYWKLSICLWCQTYYEVTYKNNNASFEGINIQYRSLSNRTCCNAFDNVCLDLQNCCYSTYICEYYFRKSLWKRQSTNDAFYICMGSSVTNGWSCSGYSPIIISCGSTDREILVVMNYLWVIFLKFGLYRWTVLQPIKSPTQLFKKIEIVTTLILWCHWNKCFYFTGWNSDLCSNSSDSTEHKVFTK